MFTVHHVPASNDEATHIIGNVRERRNATRMSNTGGSCAVKVVWLRELVPITCRLMRTTCLNQLANIEPV
ncbi:hypothetical protein [Chloroflexus sp.]|uniref:hypothetical protein n=1 Tax=Chloroflexus sp. TaxID=1904827 RepID=UPI002ACEFA4F|nr:hypothetical protein [Chloroflexus sp.]